MAVPGVLVVVAIDLIAGIGDTARNRFTAAHSQRDFHPRPLIDFRPSNILIATHDVMRFGSRLSWHAGSADGRPWTVVGARSMMRA
jgi:hypothetical protein